MCVGAYVSVGRCNEHTVHVRVAEYTCVCACARVSAIVYITYTKYVRMRLYMRVNTERACVHARACAFIKKFSNFESSRFIIKTAIIDGKQIKAN